MQRLLATVPHLGVNGCHPRFLAGALSHRQRGLQLVIVLGFELGAVAGRCRGLQAEVNPYDTVAGGGGGQRHLDRNVQIPAAAGIFREGAWAEFKV